MLLFLVPEMAFLLALKDGVPHLRFPLGERSRIGRSSECEIQVLDTELSRQHAEVRREGGAFQVADLGSRNGTYVNGARVEAPRPLDDGDELRVGTHVFVFNPPVDVVGDRDGDHVLCLVADPAPSRPAEALPAPPDHGVFVAVLEAADEGGVPRALVRTVELTGAERGFVARRAGGAWRPLAIHSEQRGLVVSRTLLEEAAGRQGPLLVDDALDDVRFAGARSVTEQRLRSVMITPLPAGRGGGEAAVTVLAVDHRERGAFDGARRAAFAGAAEALGMALRRAEPRPTPARPASTPFLGNDPSVAALLAKVARAAGTPSRVLVTGESGAGKELVARLLHDQSPRRAGPWVALNCAALPDPLLESELFGHEKGAFTGALRRKRGAFELADGGTLLLDEVGELAPATQAKLLRALEEGRFYRVGGEQPIDVDVRVIAATNRELKSLVAEGAFREDLFYRLSVIPLEVPPLRARRGDVMLLAEHFAEGLARELGRRRPHLSPEARALFEAYGWPGNVRELRNAVERLVVLHEGELVTARELPPEMRQVEAPRRLGQLPDAVTALERELVAGALAETHGNKAAAARLLGISRPTLDKKIRDLGIATEGSASTGEEA